MDTNDTVVNDIDNNALDKEFNELNTTKQKSNEMRTSLINTLYDDVSKLKIEEYDKPSAIEAKLSAFKTLDDLLKSSESSTTNSIKLIMQRTNLKNAEKANDNMADLLKEITHNTILNPGLNLPDNEGDLHSVFKDSGMKISKDELALDDGYRLEDTEEK